MRDRELRPAFDFSRIPIPVEIVSIKLNGKDVQPGEKIKGNDDWLQGLAFTFKNISDKPIAYDPNQFTKVNVIERYVPPSQKK